MELRQFRYFIVVAEELHFSRAAERLHIGQPPLSLQIKAIEKELGVVLFKRDRRKVELTDAGRLFLSEAREAIAQAARAVETAKRAARGEVGTLRLDFTTSAPLTSVLPRAIKAFRLAQPGVHIQLRIQTSQEILDELIVGHIDLGFIRPATGFILPTGLTAKPIYRDRLMAVLPAGHRLAAMKKPVPVAALADEPFIMRPRGTGVGFYEQVFRLCADAGFVPQIQQEAIEPPTILGLVAAGLGISIAPASLQAIRVGDLVWRELDVGDEAVSTMLLVFNHKRESQPRDRFVDIAQSLIAPSLAPATPGRAIRKASAA